MLTPEQLREYIEKRKYYDEELRVWVVGVYDLYTFLTTHTEPEGDKHTFWDKLIGNDDWDKDTGEYHGLER